MTNRRSLVVFLGSLLVLSGGVVAVSWLTGVGMLVLAPLYMFTPMLAGIVTCIVASPSFERAGLRVGWNRLSWLGIAAIVPIALILLGTALSVALPGVEFVPDANPLTGEGTDFAQVEEGEPAGPSLPDWPLNLLVAIVAALVLGVTLNAVFAFGEEFGWRGVFLTILTPLGFWGASAVIGLVWGLWHAPVILEGYNYPNYPVVGVGVMTVACLAMAPVYTYVTVAARSVLAPSILHGTFNAFAATMIVFAQGGSELVVNPVGAMGILVFGLATVAIAIRGPPTLTADWAIAGEGGDDAGDRDIGGDPASRSSSTTDE
ncbi:CPBP family intramembrane glutamic endopeptidase [Natronolimnohabitans sp. A-GB9]|uniref:CPBP family intramembrane glutamic endopeptidase n=1 Tax=Natronolimnohabitans sp. A-GB9 TaxID=3069757 RepID=UPI0027B6DDAB|nr:CPBP family intramembrane glutamic endopeptidase [Natronolimnohabitans sp. A-GB9]MDQ2050286.1 CPBP family intramembrane glutamic endopeptidase [Natronolimnohabitans sp. A-GB9]